MEIKNTGDSELLSTDEPESKFHEYTEREKQLLSYVMDHCTRWREYRDANYMEDWQKYERIFRGKWDESDKTRGSERSRVISPASQQAVETRHAEMMEALFGQGEFFDIKDDVLDQNGSKDVGQIKKQLYEDFARDKIRKSFDQIELMAEIYGTGIGEIVIGKKTEFYPAMVQIEGNQYAYGAGERDRFYVSLNPINPKNFLADPNGTSVDDCLGVAVEAYTSIHKVTAGVQDGTYLYVDVDTLYKNQELEPTQENSNFKDEKVLLLRYYGLVPRALIEDENIEELIDRPYDDMVEAFVVIANDGMLLQYGENPYMMRDRPIITYQDDTVPGRLFGRGTVEKALNMQVAIDGSMRTHMDSLALTSAPMMGVDLTRVPKGFKAEVIPGKTLGAHGNPQEIFSPFKFGMTDGMAMDTSKEFERMLLMATNTVDSNGQVTPVARDNGGIDMSVATMIKKNKRALVNRQEDFVIPFVKKATWRYQQFDPERYPSVDVNFVPTATLGIIAREYEQKQLAFLIQTLGKDSPITPILMASVVKNTSLSDREEVAEQLVKASQPDPKAQEMQMMQAQKQMELVDIQIAKEKSIANLNESATIKNMVQTQLMPEETRAKVLSAISRNLPDEDAAANAEFDRRYRLAELMLKEEDIDSNERIAKMQMSKQ